MENGMNFIYASGNTGNPPLATAPRTTLLATNVPGAYKSAPCHIQNGCFSPSDRCSYTLTNGSQYDPFNPSISSFFNSNNNYGSSVDTSPYSVAPSQCSVSTI